MKMLNGEIEKFSEFLMSLNLIAKQSRMRTRLVKLMAERQTEISNERIEMLTCLANKDEQSNPIITDGHFDLTNEALNQFSQEYNELVREEYILDNTEERKDMLLTIKDAVLNCNMAFSGEAALIYDRWCEIVETIEY